MELGQSWSLERPSTKLIYGYSVDMLMQSATTFRCALLLASAHHLWLNNSFKNMEETYLYHHVETLRSVNVMIANLAGSNDDNLIRCISALATSEVIIPCIYYIYKQVPLTCQNGIRLSWGIAWLQRHMRKPYLL
jgi:hypothetical protein